MSSKEGSRSSLPNVTTASNLRMTRPSSPAPSSQIGGFFPAAESKALRRQASSSIRSSTPIRPQSAQDIVTLDDLQSFLPPRPHSSYSAYTIPRSQTVSANSSTMASRSASPFESISDITRLHNLRAQEILDAVQRLELLREKAKQRNFHHPKRHFADSIGAIGANGDDEINKEFDEIFRQLVHLLESHTHSSANGKNTSAGFSSVAAAAAAALINTSDASPNITGNAASNVPANQTTSGGNEESSQRVGSTKNSTIRFLRSFLHAPYDRRIQILNHKEWDMFSALMAERCVGVVKEARSGPKKNHKEIEQRNRQFIADIQSTKYQQAAFEKVQKAKEREAATMERKKMIDQEAAYRKVHSLEQREHHRLFMVEQRKRDEEGAAKTKLHKKNMQKLWITAMHTVYVQTRLWVGLNAYRNKMYLASQAQIQTECTKFIQCWYRVQYASSRYRYRLTTQFRQYDLSMFALKKWKYHVAYGKIKRKKSKAINLVITFLKDCFSQAKTLTLIKNFRYSVIRIQRWWRSMLEIHQARLTLLELQWKKQEDERRREIMSKKNLAQLTPSQKRRIAEYQASGQYVPFNEIVKENIERAKKSYVKIPPEIRTEFIKQNLKTRLAEHRAAINQIFLAADASRKKSSPSEKGRDFDPSSTFTIPRYRSRLIGVLLPHFFVLWNKDELLEIMEKAIKATNRKEAGLSWEPTTFSTLTPSLSITHSSSIQLSAPPKK